MAAPNPKRYGLILPKKLEKPTFSRPSIFEDDSEDEHDRAAIERSIKKESMRNLKKMQTQLQLQKAMQEDPTVFEYDEVYDDLKRDKEEKKQEKAKDNKPRYIEQLLKAAENRKKESDRRMQRKIQKEREEEGEVFGDKEAYVTAAYRQKMQEMEEEEQEAARKQQLEDMMDVTKQKDLSGFYRHLLKQSVGEEKIPQNTDKQASPQKVIKEEPSALSEDIIPSSGKQKHSSSSTEQQKASSSRRDSGESNSKTPSSQTRDETASESCSHVSSGHSSHKNVEGSKKDKRMYRTRKISDPSEDEEPSTKGGPQKSEENIDADSDFSVDSEDSTDEDKEAKVELDSAVKKEEKKSEDGLKEEAEKAPSAEEIKARENEWLQLFQKRTVGVAFDEARARYLERKAAMEAQRAAFGTVQ